MGAYIFISVLILIACVLMILVVLVQDSKGGGLASNFSASNQVMGVRKTADFLEKSTWTLAIVLVVLSLLSIFVIPRNKVVAAPESQLKEYFQENQPVDYQPSEEQQEAAKDNQGQPQPGQQQPAQQQPAQQQPAQQQPAQQQPVKQQ